VYWIARDAVNPNGGMADGYSLKNWVLIAQQLEKGANHF
jgi:hypothetical protein